MSPSPNPAILKQGWSKNLADCVPKLIDAYPIVITKFTDFHTSLTVRLDYTWRSVPFQQSLFEKGRTLVDGVWVLTHPELKVTNNDGVKKPSKHNVYPSLALDFIIFSGKTPRWSSDYDQEARQLYKEMGRMFEAQGCVSGAMWKPWADPGHVQV